MGVMKMTLQKAAETQNVQADRKWAPQKPFQVGERVHLSTKYLKLRVTCWKQSPKFLGLFPIVGVINPVIVELLLPQLLDKVHPIFHSSLMKSVGEVSTLPQPSPLSGPMEVAGETHYEINWVSDCRLHRD